MKFLASRSIMPGILFSRSEDSHVHVHGLGLVHGLGSWILGIGYCVLVLCIGLGYWSWVLVLGIGLGYWSWYW